jgi:hypothetical protein
MKLIPFLARVAALGFAVFILAVAFGVAPLASFTAAAGAFLALIMAHDYSPRGRIALRRRAPVLSFPPMPSRTAGSERRAA